MATAHNEARNGDIAKLVIMSGDPIRVKNIALKYLENPILVNDIRNIYAYTGTYHGKKVTVMAHGMGIPSMGIYAYELFKFYHVEKIIRLGSCGSYDKNLKLLDIVLVDYSYTESNFAYTLNNENVNLVRATKEVNDKIKEVSQKLNIPLIEGNVVSCDCFDWYMSDLNTFLSRLPKNLNIQAAEMESFALFYLAQKFNREAACLLTVVDSHELHEEISVKEKEKNLDEMTILGLESL